MIENPYSAQHYLKQYFPIKPKLIDHNRLLRGDIYKKPTQYFFINCEPQNNLILEPQIIRRQQIIKRVNGSDRTRKRSEISPDYANRFIREFIIEQKERYEDESV